MKAGIFCAPHHPVGESPTLLLQRDLELATLADDLGLEEFWVGEHHSSGWEMIASPEVFLAAAAERTQRIRLGTGVVSLPYHHPFMTAQRIVQLDHQTRGRLIFGTGPGALASDANTLGIEYGTLRDRQDEALGVIRRLFEGGERFSYESDWFTLRDARLQILPLQEDLPILTASSISPSGMKLAGKHGLGVLSIGSASREGIKSMPTQWAFAEESAAQHGNTVHRKDWRVLMSWHLAETREQARQEVVDGLHRWYNEYQVGVLGLIRGGVSGKIDDKWELLNDVDSGDHGSGYGTSCFGTPDDLVARIRHMQEITGGFGVVLGMAHDWANWEATKRSWDLFARYVMPQLNGTFTNLQASADYLGQNQERLMADFTNAVMAKVKGDAKAEEAMAITQRETDSTVSR